MLKRYLYKKKEGSHKQEKGVSKENKRLGSEWDGVERVRGRDLWWRHGGIFLFGFIGASARAFMHFYTQELYILQINRGDESVLNDT